MFRLTVNSDPSLSPWSSHQSPLAAVQKPVMWVLWQANTLPKRGYMWVSYALTFRCLPFWRLCPSPVDGSGICTRGLLGLCDELGDTCCMGDVPDFDCSIPSIPKSYYPSLNAKVICSHWAIEISVVSSNTIQYCVEYYSNRTITDQPMLHSALAQDTLVL